MKAKKGQRRDRKVKLKDVKWRTKGWMCEVQMQEDWLWGWFIDWIEGNPVWESQMAVGQMQDV